jgi:hypothetical protein
MDANVEASFDRRHDSVRDVPRFLSSQYLFLSTDSMDDNNPEKTAKKQTKEGSKEHSKTEGTKKNKKESKKDSSSSSNKTSIEPPKRRTVKVTHINLRDVVEEMSNAEPFCESAKKPGIAPGEEQDKETQTTQKDSAVLSSQSSENNSAENSPISQTKKTTNFRAQRAATEARSTSDWPMQIATQAPTLPGAFAAGNSESHDDAQSINSPSVLHAPVNNVPHTPETQTAQAMIVDEAQLVADIEGNLIKRAPVAEIVQKNGKDFMEF